MCSEPILIIHIILFWLVIDKCVYLLCLFRSLHLCVSVSGTSGRVRWFRSTTVTWEPSIPSPLLTRIDDLSARRTTRVFEFGSGEYRLQPEILMHCFEFDCTVFFLSKAHTPQYLVTAFGSCLKKFINSLNVKQGVIIQGSFSVNQLFISKG